MIRVALVEHAINVPALLSEVTADGTGASALFVGTVRNVNDGRAVSGIEYSAYTDMARDELHRIAAEASVAFDGLHVVIEHRLGMLTLQDASVAIAVAHARRAPALDGLRFVIEELKRRVPIWKREHYLTGERVWVDPTAASSTGATP